MFFSRLFEYLIFFWLGYTVLKSLFRLFIRPPQQAQGGDNSGPQRSYRKPGEMHIDHIPDSPKSSSHDDDGEYIPYKEIKD